MFGRGEAKMMRGEKEGIETERESNEVRGGRGVGERDEREGECEDI